SRPSDTSCSCGPIEARTHAFLRRCVRGDLHSATTIRSKVRETMRQQPAKRVAVLLTGDVDYSNHHRDADKRQAFERLLGAGRELGLSLTFFFVAKEAEQVAEYPCLLRTAGHEIACHGLTHGDEEEYDAMPPSLQQEYLQKATAMLGTIAGRKPVSFRGP